MDHKTETLIIPLLAVDSDPPVKSFQIFLLSDLKEDFHWISVIINLCEAWKILFYLIPFSICYQFPEVLHIKEKPWLLFQPSAYKLSPKKCQLTTLKIIEIKHQTSQIKYQKCIYLTTPANKHFKQKVISISYIKTKYGAQNNNHHQIKQTIGTSLTW